jgi:hypothetical protein
MDHLESPKKLSYPLLEITDLGFSYNDTRASMHPLGLCTPCDDEGLSLVWISSPSWVGYS